MKLRLLAVLTVAVFAAAGCASTSRPQAPATGAPPAPHTATAETSGIRITVSAAAAAFDAKEPLAVEARVVNEGNEPVRYVKSNGCDNGIRLELLDQSGGHGWFRVDGPPRACTEAMEIGTLEPGKAISDRYIWDRVPDEPDLSGGEYTIRASFSRGEDYQAVAPIVTQLKIMVTGGAAYIRQEEAITAAKAHQQVQQWWAAHTSGIIRREGDQFFVLQARSADDPTGEWVPAAEEYANQVLRESIQVNALFKANLWTVTLDTKFGPAPRSVLVRVGGTTGRVESVELR